MRKWNVGALMVVLVLAVALAGCSSGGGDAGGSPSSAPPASSAAASPSAPATESASASAPAVPEGPTYLNPVFEPVLADPTIVRGKDGMFYAYGTEDDWGDGEGPRLIPIIKSTDLVKWEVVGEAFQEKPAWKDSGGLWAPSIHEFNGQYYLYYSMSVWGDSNPGIGVAVSDKPEGPFTDKGKVFDSEDIVVYNSIDPFLFVDEGKPYLFWGSFHGIYMVPLTDDGLKPAGDKIKIAGNMYEGPFILKRDGFYYFFGSSGACCEGENSSYRASVARSEKLEGPYVSRNGDEILFTEGTPVVGGMYFAEEGARKFVGPGHNSIITDDNGTDWFIYHAIDASYPNLGNGATRRPLMIDPLIWQDGWPALKNMEPSTTPQPAPVFYK